MAYMMEDRLKSATEEADKEKALKEVAEATAREKSVAIQNAEERARIAEGTRILAEHKAVEMETKLGEIKLRLAEAESINSPSDKEIAELKVTLEEGENKFYNMGFTDAENSVEPVMFQSRRYGFNEGWEVAVLALRVPEDSPFINPDQIPYPEPPPLVQNPIDADEENTPSMRELVQEIDSHAKLIDLEITSDPNTVQGLTQPRLPDPNLQSTMDATPVQPNQLQDPTV